MLAALLAALWTANGALQMIVGDLVVDMLQMINGYLVVDSAADGNWSSGSG